MATRRDYRRLPGTGWGLLGRSSLWLGKDHLLAAICKALNRRS